MPRALIRLLRGRHADGEVLRREVDRRPCPGEKTSRRSRSATGAHSERRFLSTREQLSVTWKRYPSPPGTGSPCSWAGDSLLYFLGKSPWKTRQEAGIEGSRHAQKPGFAQFPCTFPVDQGNRQRDGFALDCLLRQ